MRKVAIAMSVDHEKVRSRVQTAEMGSLQGISGLTLLKT